MLVFLSNIIKLQPKQVLNITSKRYIKIITKLTALILFHYRDF